MSLKDKISSPLEAGPSLLDAHHLPPQLLPALEYTSARLARKSLHLTLVVARRDYQLPPSPVLCSPPLPLVSSPAAAASPAPSPSSRSRFTRRLHLPRWGRPQPTSSPTWTSASSSVPTSPRSAISSPAYTPMSLDFPRNQHGGGPLSPRSPMWPLTPMTPLSPPPMTPSTGLSSVPTEGSSYGFPMTPQHGVRLIHHGNLPPKAEKTLQAALAKAGRKARPGTHVAPALSAPACGFNAALFNNSIAQNEVLFSSDGLSLLSLDRLYSLKAALSSYSKTGSPLRLEDAVDELRRYVLASGRKVSKMHLLRSYDWLNVSHSALSDLDRMYRRAYGGVEMQGGIDGMYFAPVPEAPSVWSDDDDDDDNDDEAGHHDDYHDQDSGVDVEGLPDSPTIVDGGTVGMAVSTTPMPPASPKRSPSPKMPLLRVQTSFVKTPAHRRVDAPDSTTTSTKAEPDKAPPEEAAAAEDDVLTARPDDEGGQAASFRNELWRNTQATSIAQVLSPGPDPPPLDGSMTPHGYDDISPITRGEWGFLLVDQGFQNARTVAVTTF